MTEASQVLMARQPIFDRELNVVAYELLYRSDDETSVAKIINGHQATSSVLLNAYTSIIENQEPKRLPAFLNLPREMFEADTLPSMSHKQLVIEVLEDVKVDSTLLEAVARYKQAGYRIALDDFVYSPEYDPLLALADIIKLDILALGMDQVRNHVSHLKQFRASLLAEKIETYEELRECIALGFKLFQGYFLQRPEVVAGRRLESNEAVLLQLVAELNQAEPDDIRVTDLIEQDPALTYRLLKIVNSAALAMQHPINSVHEALVILGLNEVRKWISLIALSGQKRKPSELTRQILTAARLAELVTTKINSLEVSASGAFLGTLLYRLDAALDIDREHLLTEIAISEEIKDAVRDGSGPLGKLIKKTYALCDGDWNNLPCDELEVYRESYLQALTWVNETMSCLDND
ncbi:EAL and HDOD domain-containing protein [Marinobacterium lutimaris]|uniref:EAL and modified HD-GYP domain-containing signal transduction protein n=1 Tax=Marinobacterium lutimaris TaxID=568106 RepID=A0A1H5UGZ1_9GAMM|nr:HDOD domain-containing protein [Marinobacterium lutimaris]SEF74310.1 EAL and modified HD-GYP domain-containing signal transduction protein [Marinobacterium lutimaris]